MSDPFTQLKADIATLIATSHDHINKLVAQVAANAQAAVSSTGASAGISIDNFTAQITQLSADVQSATADLKARVEAALGTAATVVSGAVQAAENFMDLTAAPTAPAAPAVAPTATVSVQPQAVATAAPVAVAQEQQPDPAAVTIGPDSFKAGA